MPLEDSDWTTCEPYNVSGGAPPFRPANYPSMIGPCFVPATNIGWGFLSSKLLRELLVKCLSHPRFVVHNLAARNCLAAFFSFALPLAIEFLLLADFSFPLLPRQTGREGKLFLHATGVEVPERWAESHLRLHRH